MIPRRAKLALWVVWWLAMFIATTIPGHSLGDTPLWSFDKLIHCSMYGVLTLLVLWWASGESWWRSAHLLLLMGCLILWGAIDELHQPLVGRSCSLYDWLADCCGVLLAALLWWLYNVKLSPCFKGKKRHSS